MRRVLIVPLVAAGVAVAVAPAAAASPARVIGSFQQGSSTFEQANPGPVGLIGSYTGLAPGNYRTGVYAGAGCAGSKLVSGVFTPTGGSVVTQQNLGSFDLTTVQSVGLLRWGVLIGCDNHPILIKGGPF